MAFFSVLSNLLDDVCRWISEALALFCFGACLRNCVIEPIDGAPDRQLRHFPFESVHPTQEKLLVQNLLGPYVHATGAGQEAEIPAAARLLPTIELITRGRLP
jgi:hypothetical protein